MEIFSNRFLAVPLRSLWAPFITLGTILFPLGSALASPNPDLDDNGGVNLGDNLGDNLDDLGLLYRDKSSQFLQEVWLLGRYHGQYIITEGAQTELGEYESRRIRLGAQLQMLDDLTIHAQSIAGSNFNPSYGGFTELWAQWEFSAALKLTVGQQKHRFTHDRNVSSRYLNYLERGLLTNLFGADYTPAVTAQGSIGKGSYYTGVFTNRTGREIDDALTNLNSGYSLLGAVYYDLGKPFKIDSAALHFSTVASDSNSKATNLNRFDRGLSSALILTDKNFSLISELVSGTGGELGGAHGINLQPSVFLNDRWQLVGRYQFAYGERQGALTPQFRYEEPSGLPAGERYHAGYFGVNFYLAKHRLKLMQGVEYSAINGQGLWTFGTMVRFYFGPHSGGAFPMNQTLPGDLWTTD